MIPEREREALMRLTMCARGECPMCKYEEQCDNWDFRMELATKNMNILADALRKTEPTVNKPIRIDGLTEKCPKCGEKVMYAVGTGTIFHGASESYEDWRIIKHDYCPRCGTKIEREDK